jgi:hypothetical protein
MFRFAEFLIAERDCIRLAVALSMSPRRSD